MLHFRLNSSSGIGLLQYVLVIFTISSLIAVTYILVEPVKNPSAVRDTQAQLDAFKIAVQKFRTDNGANPPNLTNLETTTGTPCVAVNSPLSPTFRKLSGWCGPYIDRVYPGSDKHLRDAWGILLQYNGIVITSCGADRTCGNADDLSITP